MSYEKPNKKAIGCMYVSSFILTTIAIGILIGVLSSLPEDFQLGKILFISLIGLLVLSFLAGPPIRYRRYRYFINEECIDVKEGFLWIQRNIVPIERLHNIEIHKGPINRLFGISKVTVITAGSRVSINFLEDRQAEFIADSLKKRINEVAVVKKMAEVTKAGGTVGCDLSQGNCNDTVGGIKQENEYKVSSIKED